MVSSSQDTDSKSNAKYFSHSSSEYRGLIQVSDLNDI